jgi:hypothetical protein
MLPAPVADLETARLATGADDVIAYFAAPGSRGDTGDGLSYAHAEIRGVGGGVVASTATLGPGLDTSAAIAAETAHRILQGHPDVRGGAWTPGALFGPALVHDACPINLSPAGAP